MGSGKSTILEQSKFIRQKGFIRSCDNYDILGVSQAGADSLSKYSKADVISSLKNYSGEKLLVAGEYYSKQVDLQRFQELGFDIYVILLSVTREEIYKRVLSRGNGLWNENTYRTNLTNRISFFKAHKGRKWIMENNTLEEQKLVIQRLLEI